MLDICKILIFLVWVNHVLACCWYGIADSVTEEEGSWLHQPRFENQRLGSKTEGLRSPIEMISLL